MTDPVLQHYRDALSEGVPQASEAQRAAVLSRLAGSRRQRTQRRAAFGMVAAAAVGLLAWVGLRPADPGITCSQGEQTLAAGAWIRADQDERVSFSDGSHFAVAENASLRLSAMTRDTVEVMVESGAIAVHVEPNGPRRWRFFAGPFEVEVVGTDLEVDWSADQTRLRVGVSHGRVRVHGNGGRVSVSAGEEVEMRTDGHELRTLAEAEPEPVVDSAPEPEVSAPAPAESRVRPTPRPAAPDWRALADDGRFAEACRAGGRGGRPGRLDAASLLDLADACRLSRQRREAERMLQTVRRRFPGAPAQSALFRLGRMAADTGRHREAMRWFDEYTREAPRGRHAAEAAGRALEAASSLGLPVTARAQRYLRVYPRGTYRQLAESLVPLPE